ncbi:zinc uptake transporter [Gottschalkia purinilytica]|uniref:Zinc uptake transporter n=1 Tax=Gottschalkia purinilytica TaxID=1503 RepID=A0A0L0WE81_GOTPU|nr:ZIP family metal transporter [Gottschalkia purinilytica]KNF09730.1 zinc uptake transporter [Gottschalkia purinilytica]
MESIIFTTVIGSLVGIVGTGLGGYLAIKLVRPNNRFLGMLLGMTSGLMLAVVAFDLLPEALSIGGLWIEILGVLLGVAMMFIVESKVLSCNANSFKSTNKGNFLKTGALIGVGIALHNFPEGLAIGSGFMLTPQLGMTMALIIALHDLPEGIAMALPLKMSGMSNFKIFFLTLLTGIPTGFGAMIGGLLGSISDVFIALCLAIAGGAMLYITCGELIPNAKALHKGRASTIGIGIGFALGIFISNSI